MDKQPKCFVPDCYNEVGVLFPKNPIVKKKWLKSLGLDHLDLKIHSNSFVCLDHFEEDGQPGAFPKPTNTSQAPSSPPPLQSPQPVRDYNRTVDSKRVTRSSHQAEKAMTDLKCDRTTKTKRTSTSSVADSPKTSSVTDTTRKSSVANYTRISIAADSTPKPETSKKVEERRQDNTASTKFEYTCRLCTSQSTRKMEHIYKRVYGPHTIALMITVCLKPLKVSRTDNLSKYVCLECLASLKRFFKFHQFCLSMDAKQREAVSAEKELIEEHGSEGHESDGLDEDSDNSEEYLHEERLSDYEENKENEDESRSEITNGSLFKRSISAQEIKAKDKKSEIDIKFDKVEEELAKVLEGKRSTTESENKLQIQEPKRVNHSVSGKDESSDNTLLSVPAKGKDDEVYTENIIIEMINDEEPQSNEALVTPKLPITIRRINSDLSNKKAVKRKLSSSNASDTFDNVTMIKTIKTGHNEEVVRLPSGIKVEIREKFSSQLGVFSSQPIKYLFSTEYLLAGGYLYEYWLAKNNVRHLHCLVPKCPGVAKQTRMDNNEFSNEVEVIKAHNHESPDTCERKRQMFYNIMFGKMRRDKNFNFKLLYEQFCKLDEELMEILPLRKVISEICKQGPNVPLPNPDSYDQFYELIETDPFHRIHFTDNHVQFYQGKFEADDGTKAVVFANPEIVELYSYSKLMFVDASFLVETNDFSFKMVTVLVWVYDSYYPIFYAFVNHKSQELYKQIFSYLYNTLAPNLRPQEIITDYEANLYYALGETYVESSIGGSMFYYTQNLYKKICSLKLSRELDLNSNFRSIYNMLIMLPLLPVNTILDALGNIQVQAKELGLFDLTKDLFVHVENEWIGKVTPEFFCVHRLENRINENIVAPFKKLRDLIMIPGRKAPKNSGNASIVTHIEKVLELEKFLRETYSGPGRKTFAKDLSSSQKKIVLKAWNFIENHPKININHFFLKVLGYIKCMENQLWIWGFYRYEGNTNDDLINAANFSIDEGHHVIEYQENQEYSTMEDMEEDPQGEHLETQEGQEEEEREEDVIEEFYIEEGGAIRRVGKKSNAAALIEEFTDDQQNTETEAAESTSEKEHPAVLMEAVIDENGSFVLQNTSNAPSTSSTENLFVYK